jgi:hypothetical protein
LAAAVGPGDDIPVVEPDARPDVVEGCLSPAQNAERYQLLRYAMRRLGALPRARVYLDAGNPGMFADPAQIAGPLRRAGLRYGRGPYTGPDAAQWCNPPGRALGPSPRPDPGPAGIDAYLWIKDPGASDGPCNGGPPAGQFWPQYAITLGRGRSPRSATRTIAAPDGGRGQGACCPLGCVTEPADTESAVPGHGARPGPGAWLLAGPWVERRTGRPGRAIHPATTSSATTNAQ